MSDRRDQIERATSILKRGGLVAFATETVYGLGADATNAGAVRKSFLAKGRPSTNPLIVHVARVEIARRYALRWPAEAQRLAEKFWPGPLTIVVPKVHEIVDEVTAGLDTVGLRVPNHPLALELLESFAGPVAAPSANRSNRVSPTTADHVRAELGDSVDLILDGGPCIVGIESTVISLVASPTILRPGMISREQIESIIGRVREKQGAVNTDVAALSPGQQPVHYAPTASAFRFDTAQLDQVFGRASSTDAMLLLTKTATRSQAIQMPTSESQYAQQLYSTLRELDDAQVAAIYIELPPDEPQWTAVRDRIIRATRPL